VCVCVCVCVCIYIYIYIYVCVSTFIAPYFIGYRQTGSCETTLLGLWCMVYGIISLREFCILLTFITR